jgi:hypothetical protein
MGLGGQCHAQAALPLGKKPGTYCTFGFWATGPVWTGAENLVLHRNLIHRPSSP